MLKKIVLGLILILGLFLGYVYRQPAGYEVQREIAIDRPADLIFPYLNNLKLMEQWSPWGTIDPELKMMHSGPEAGIGAKASWDSKGQMGAGSATVTESVLNETVRTALEYTRPFAMTQEGELSIKPSGTQSMVRWTVRGNNAFFGRLMCFFMDMDKMVGGDFEKGLTKLKAIAEQGR